MKTSVVGAFGATALILGMFVGTPAYADAINEPPPADPILDLSGTPIPGGGNGSFQEYSVSFTATNAETAITFAFRDDPAFVLFSNASVTDTTSAGGNLLLNGDFAGGTYTNNGNSATPVDWIYANQYGATFGGVITGSCGQGSSDNCWYDGAVQAYDAISQTIDTTVGDVYNISFYVGENSNGSEGTDFSDLSTNGNITGTGGNGINVTVYAQNGLPAPGNAVPEPASMAVVGTGLVGLFLMRRRKLS